MKAGFKAYKDITGETIYYQGVIKRSASDPANAQTWQCDHRHPFARWARDCAQRELWQRRLAQKEQEQT